MWNGRKNALQELYRSMYEYHAYGKEYELKYQCFLKMFYIYVNYNFRLVINECLYLITIMPCYEYGNCGYEM